ncbi:MAG: matrixin family metalloprotease [Candidatus Nealsonbacteria bacterium]|nr:matrixin family metalloprotease [Candidatus Nealsonbacteria bacterium]
MKSFWVKFFISITAILLLFGFGYFNRDSFSRTVQDLLNRFQPCQRPIMYSIASIDPRFGLTKEELLGDIMQAEKIWESQINKQLFEYSPTGDLKINLIYDYRQKATEELQKLGIVIHDDKATYEALQARYDSFVASYDKKKAYIADLIESYEKTKSLYEKDVKYWNSRGGAPKKEYDALEQRRIDLDNQIALINQSQGSLNELAGIINSIVTVLNKLITGLNLQVNTYNTIGASTGKEFSEGEYISDANGTTINIFQFNDKDSLVRVLAHELGHALGLEHLDNPEAIMYRLNEGTNENLTLDDIAVLKNLCGIE